MMARAIASRAVVFVVCIVGIGGARWVRDGVTSREREEVDALGRECAGAHVSHGVRIVVVIGADCRACEEQVKAIAADGHLKPMVAIACAGASAACDQARRADLRTCSTSEPRWASLPAALFIGPDGPPFGVAIGFSTQLGVRVEAEDRVAGRRKENR